MSLEEKFWKCSKASHVPLFEDAMKEMKEEDEEAYNWLILEAPRYWSRSHFKFHSWRKQILAPVSCPGAWICSIQAPGFHFLLL